MFDFSQISDAAVAAKIKEEAEGFMARCHFGIQGIVKTEIEIEAACNRLLDSGFRAIAFDTEMNYLPLAKKILSGLNPLHAAVAYPMGRMRWNKKIKDLEQLSVMGVTDTCVCLDYQAIFSNRWRDVEKEASSIVKATEGMFEYNAFVIPATLLSDTEIIAVCDALDAAGVISVKVNPGANLWVSFEEIALIKRKFPGRFDIHPSGGIRTLEDVERYLDLGCTVIHSAASLDITEEFIAKKMIEYGVKTDD